MEFYKVIWLCELCVPVVLLYSALSRSTHLSCVPNTTLRRDALHTQRRQPPSCSINPIRWHHIIWEPITAHTILYVNCIPKCSWHSWTAWTLKRSCPKMLVWKYHPLLCKTPKELRSHLHCNRSLKSHILYSDIILVHALKCYTMIVNCIKS